VDSSARTGLLNPGNKIAGKTRRRFRRIGGAFFSSIVLEGADGPTIPYFGAKKVIPRIEIPD
jgi:hypothetical protein